MTEPPDSPPGQTNRAKVITVLVFLGVVVVSVIACLLATSTLNDVLDINPFEHF